MQKCTRRIGVVSRRLVLGGGIFLFFVGFLIPMARTCLRAFRTFNTSPAENGMLDKPCSCVECTQDVECGGLWRGDAVGGDANYFDKITVVVSHCLKSLEWLDDFTRGFPTINVTIISKCDKPVVGAPLGSTIVRLSNVGRCDHSYAYWISERTLYPPSSDEEKELIVFLKDDRSIQSIHQSGEWRSLYDMARIASKTGFSCGLEPTATKKLGNVYYSISAYHEVLRLVKFNVKRYESMDGRYSHIESKKVAFPSKYKNLGDWASSLGLQFGNELASVCYAGTFGVTAKQLRNQKHDIWKELERSLSRGNNIEEGHFAERTWANLLSRPLSNYQVSALREYAEGKTGVYSELGALLHDSSMFWT